MKKTIFAFKLIILAALCRSQTITIVDKTNLQPLQNVSVYSLNPVISTTTNTKGQAAISAFNNVDSVRFLLIGYVPAVLSYKKLEASGFKVSLTQSSFSFDEVVISASRFEEKRKDVPQPIQVIKATDLAFMNQQTTAEVLQNSGNVLVQKSQLGGGSPIIRGFEANKVLIVVDGVRMNNAIFRGGHLQNVITMDNSILNKVEIVFGPGSVAYGSDALGGVMHFFTKNPLLSDSIGKTLVKANAFTRYSTAYDEKTGHADINFGFKKIGLLTSFTYSDFGDLRQGNIRNDFYGNWGKRTYYAQRIDGKDSMVINNDVNIQKFTGYNQYDVMQKILFQQSDKINHVVNFQYSTTSNIPRYDRLTEFDSKGKLTNAEWYYGPQKRLFGSYTLNLNSANRLYNNARVILAYQDIEESRHNRGFGKSKLNNRIENVKVYTLNADFDKKINRHELRYGLEGMFNDVNSTAYFLNIDADTTGALDTRYPDGGSTMKTYAGYFMHTWEITPKLILTNGIRFSQIALDAKFIDKTFFPFPFDNVSQNSSAINGNIGMVFMPGMDWRFTGILSSGFRAPNVDDLTKVFESVPGRVIVPNPDLKPENTYNAEAGISKTFHKTITLEGTGFYTMYKDAITVGGSTFNGLDSIDYNGKPSKVITSLNAAEAYIYGANGSLTADITDAFSVASTINFTYGRIKTDTTDYPLDHIPPVFGKTSFNLKLKKFRGEFYVMYNGWKRLKDYNLVGEDNIQYATIFGMPSWLTLNARMAYQVNKNLQAQVGLENILDQNYRVFGSGLSAPGRNLVLTLRGSF